MEIKKHLKVVLYLKQIFDQHDITWGLGGSLLLYLSGIDVSVADIDIIIDENDNEKVLTAIKGLDYKIIKNDDTYKTSNFYELTIDDVDVDLMLGFKVSKGNTVYKFNFDKNEIKYYEYKGTRIPLSNLNEWYLAYKAMNRKTKIEILESYMEGL